MTPYLADRDVTVHLGDVLDVLATLPDESVHMCVTSPPFYGLRDYGTGEWEGGDEGCDHIDRRQGGTRLDEEFRNRAAERNYDPGYVYANAGKAKTASGKVGNTCGKCGARRVDQQIGLESTPEDWCARLVQVFREVRRVLRADGTCWVEIGDTYASRPPGSHGGWNGSSPEPNRYTNQGDSGVTLQTGTKPKDLIGAPWLLAFALRADGWYLRSDIIWERPNPMPESVTDRPTKSHSYVFLLSKAPRYFYDADAIREPYTPDGRQVTKVQSGNGAIGLRGTQERERWAHSGRNKRSVWTVPTQPLPYDHYAAYPEALVEVCVLAGTSERGCCPECGAPWVRVVERTPMEVRATPKRARWQDEDDHARTQVGGTMTQPPASKTTGFALPCECDADPIDGEPPLRGLTACTVLDPFLGSGTTAIVARRLGRKCIGIELNEKYCAIAAERLQQLSLLAEGAA